MSRKSRALPPSSFRCFNSSPEVIRLVVLMYTGLCETRDLKPECHPLLNDLDRLQQATIEKDGKVVTTRTYATGQVRNVFKAARIALPHNVDERQA